MSSPKRMHLAGSSSMPMGLCCCASPQTFSVAIAGSSPEAGRTAASPLGTRPRATFLKRRGTGPRSGPRVRSCYAPRPRQPPSSSCDPRRAPCRLPGDDRHPPGGGNEGTRASFTFDDRDRTRDPAVLGAAFALWRTVSHRSSGRCHVRPRGHAARNHAMMRPLRSIMPGSRQAGPAGWDAASRPDRPDGMM